MKVLNKALMLGYALVLCTSSSAFAGTATSGFQVLNKSTSDYQTATPSGCAGITFPGPAYTASSGKSIPAGYLLSMQKSGDKTMINVDKNANVSDCTISYNSGTKEACKITVSAKGGTLTDVKASGSCTYSKPIITIK